MVTFSMVFWSPRWSWCPSACCLTRYSWLGCVTGVILSIWPQLSSLPGQSSLTLAPARGMKPRGSPSREVAFHPWWPLGSEKARLLLKKNLWQNASNLWVLSLHSCLVILPSDLFGVFISPTEAKKELLASSCHSLFWPYQHYKVV